MAHWFKFHAADFLSDKAMRLSDAQIGMLTKLWALHCRDGSLPNDGAGLAAFPHLRATPARMERELGWIRTFFDVSEDGSRLFSKRMREQLEEYEAKCEKNRDSGRRGGRKANAQPNAKADAKPNGLHIANRTLTEPRTKNQEPEREEPKPKHTAEVFQLPDWAQTPEFTEAWKAFEETRHKLRAPLTHKAVMCLLKKLAALRAQGFSPVEVVLQSVERGWRGVFEIRDGGSNGAGNRAQQRQNSNLSELEKAKRGIRGLDHGAGDDVRGAVAGANNVSNAPALRAETERPYAIAPAKSLPGHDEKP